MHPIIDLLRDIALKLLGEKFFLMFFLNFTKYISSKLSKESGKYHLKNMVALSPVDNFFLKNCKISVCQLNKNISK